MSENLRPDSIQNIESKNLRLGVKSSNSNVKSSFALLYCLWKSNECPSKITYTQEYQGTVQIKGNTVENVTRVELETNVKENLMNFFDEQIQNNNGVDFERIINENELLQNHIEPLLVTFEEIYKIATFEFLDSNKNITSERTGGYRYNKQIIYTHNIDYIDLIVDINLDEYKNILFNWIVNIECDSDLAILEDRLIKSITLISEYSIYKIKQDKNKENDILFFNEGIYKKFENGNEIVDINDNIEKRGSIRILPNILQQDLNYFLKIDEDDTNKVKLKNIDDLQKLISYRERIDASIKLRNISLKTGIKKTVVNINKPHNRIIFGAPGTGKSHTIDNDKENVFEEKNCERVTFHPNYSYAQFVGSYKPIIKDKGAKKERISYEFVPGPFMRVLIASLNNEEDTPNLLIIEEINRANPAGVFGDVFQLLDRDSNGKSKYTINISEEMKTYIKENVNDDEIKDYIENNGLYIPENMYIWATMNSADQGVYPMDSAFKRRWSFEYLDIDAGEESLNTKSYNKIKLKTKVEGEIVYDEYNWNDIRRNINSLLKKSTSRINEDKLLGPFFLSEDELKLSENNMQEDFDNIFKSKLLMYLYEDVLKHKKTDILFYNGIESLSDLVKAYDNGNVFSFDINKFKYVKETPSVDAGIIVDSENKDDILNEVSDDKLLDQSNHEDNFTDSYEN